MEVKEAPATGPRTRPTDGDDVLSEGEHVCWSGAHHVCKWISAQATLIPHAGGRTATLCVPTGGHDPRRAQMSPDAYDTEHPALRGGRVTTVIHPLGHTPSLGPHRLAVLKTAVTHAEPRTLRTEDGK